MRRLTLPAALFVIAVAAVAPASAAGPAGSGAALAGNPGAPIRPAPEPSTAAEIAAAAEPGADARRFGALAPGRTHQVALSNSDVNHIACPQPIQDVIYSEEKGAVVKSVGSDLFVKLLVQEDPDGGRRYSHEPLDLTIVCAGEIYKLLGIPEPLPMQTIRLGSPDAGRVARNLEEMAPLPLERRIEQVLRKVLRDQVPESWTLAPPPASPPPMTGLRLSPRRTLVIEGVGMRVREYAVAASAALELSETDFLHLAGAAPLLAVAVDPLSLSPGEGGRLLIIEKTLEEGRP